MELRQASGDGPGTIFGVALVYGAPSSPLDASGIREQIMAGAFGHMADSVFANLGHQRDRLLGKSPGAGLILRDSLAELRFELSLPDTADGRDAATLVRQGILMAASIEFIRRQTHLEGRTLVVTKAALKGVSLVDRPAYSRSQIEEIRTLTDQAVEKNRIIRRPRRWVI